MLTEEEEDLLVISVAAEEHEAAFGHASLGGEFLLGPLQRHRTVHLALQHLLDAGPYKLRAKRKCPLLTQPGIN